MTKRLALVTSGITSIGETICKSSKSAGYDVAVNYAANEERADVFLSMATSSCRNTRRKQAVF